MTAEFVAAAVVLAASTVALPAKAETVLRVAMTAGDIPDWTGQPDQGFEGYRFVGWSLYDALINWDLSRSDVEAGLTPGLAVKWGIDPANNKRWVFELRKDVKFHDDCKLDADLVVWNIQRLIDDKTPGFNPVQYSRHRSRSINVERAEKIDDGKVAIYTKTPDSFLPYNVSVWYMISKCAMEKANFDNALYAKAPAGTGPYKFDKVVPRERLELTKNADYWNPKRVPKHDRLVLIPMPEATTRAAALLAGQVDFIEAPSPDTIPRLKSSGMRVITLPYPHNWHYQLNFVEPPFNDVRVRRAANHALNRAEMVEMLGGIAQEGYATYPPNAKLYGNPVKYEYDPAKATALLKEAGCHPCAITFAISTSGSGQMQPLPMNELVKAQLEAVGFKVKLDVMDWNTLLDVSFKGREKYPQYNGINISRATQDPPNGLLRFVMKQQWSPNGGNWGWYENQEIEDIVAEAMRTFDDEIRDILMTKVHEIASREAIMLFVTHDLNPRALSPRVHGFVQAQSWFQDLTPITIVEGGK
ncbi:MAG: ABC transporter substrate-binding protein [Hyphomicrobiales bacterium]|nr:ABC transporter substrate-binding protein [Hyphomicrobiales bacterium]